MKRSQFIVYPVCILLVFFAVKAQAQNMQRTLPRSSSGIGVQQLPGLVAGPAVLNNGIVFPLENLDSFQDSTLDPTTLGKRIEQRSNLELNEPGENQSEFGGREVSERTNQTQIEEEESAPSFVPLSHSGKTLIYVWKDRDGVVHFTNLIKSVPPEYREQATRRAEELQKEAQNTF